jgi:CDP-diglyceride synthetase
MSYAIYRWLHVVGIILLFTAVGGLVMRQITAAAGDAGRKLAGLTHGLALFLVLFSGFGLLAVVQVPHNPAAWPAWVWIKFVIWLALGGIVVLIRRAPHLAKILWWGIPLLGIIASYLALTHPPVPVG